MVSMIRLKQTEAGNPDFSFSAPVRFGGKDADTSQLADPTYLSGFLDEVRISDTERSADWIEASWRSQNGTLRF